MFYHSVILPHSALPRAREFVTLCLLLGSHHSDAYRHTYHQACSCAMIIALFITSLFCFEVCRPRSVLRPKASTQPPIHLPDVSKQTSDSNIRTVCISELLIVVDSG
ncbi:hypothetical protein CC79DRAFT_843732 [Sarocladium strictum]